MTNNQYCPTIPQAKSAQRCRLSIQLRSLGLRKEVIIFRNTSGDLKMHPSCFRVRDATREKI